MGKFRIVRLSRYWGIWPDFNSIGTRAYMDRAPLLYSIFTAITVLSGVLRSSVSTMSRIILHSFVYLLLEIEKRNPRG